MLLRKIIFLNFKKHIPFPCQERARVRLGKGEKMFNTNDLNPVQSEAVLHTDGPLLILAGAGSGKTRVLTYRIAYLIKEKGIYPSNILAITFTNKAAKEMKERIYKLVGDESDSMWIGTFHSICVRILRRDIEKLGYKRSFVIYDSSDQQTLIKQCLKELNYNEKNFPPSGVHAEISKAKNSLINTKTYQKMYDSDFRMSKIANIYSLYQKKLFENNALDFDDLIFKTIDLFNQNPDILDYYQKRFKHILVDEYQDTNSAQYELISLLAAFHKNLCVVGDDDQSIYGWRGADITNILDFEKQYKNCKVIKLEQNYRSTQNILDAANNVIVNNLGRKTKKLWTGNGTGNLIKIYSAVNEHDEADYVANQIIKGIENEGSEYSQYAILYRMNAQSRVFEESFMKNTIPYRIIGGLKFYERKEIKDILAYLRVIQNPNDSISLKRIINVPKRGIGDTTIERIETFAKDNGISLYESLLSTPKEDKSYNKIMVFVNTIGEFIEKKDDLSISKLTDKILKDTGYISQLENEETIEAESRLENLKEFLSVALEFEERSENQSLEEFLVGISLVSDIDNFQGSENAVVLMTLHSAKGLEFDNVFMCGVEEGIFPSYRSSLDETEIEEERRLCYVGITRARKNLYITYAKQRTIFGSTGYYSESRFLKEIPKELTDEVGTPKKEIKKKETIFSESFKEKFGYMAASKASGNSKYNIGDIVEHKKFGIGTILDIQSAGGDSMLKIAFSDVGTKQLMAGFAELKVVN